MVAAWRSGSVVGLARLVLGWVTVSRVRLPGRHFISVCNQPPRSTQPSIPPWDGKMSTSQRAVTFCGWRVNAGMV